MKVFSLISLFFSFTISSQNLPTVYTQGGSKYYDYAAEERAEIKEYGEYISFSTCISPIEAEVSASSFLKGQISLD